jgi:hypothetical protein
VLASPALRAEDKPQDKDKPPQEQYSALMTEFSQAQQAYFGAMRAAKSHEERQKAAEKAPKMEKFAPRFLELAVKHPKDPVTVDALAWIVTNVRGEVAKAERDKAFDLLSRDYIESDKLGTVCQNLAFGGEKQSEAFLRTVMEKSPHKAVKGEACLALVRRSLQLKAGAEGESIVGQFVDQYAADVKPERIAQLCRQLGFSTDKGTQSLLRTLLEKDKRRDVQGVACLALGQSLKMQADADADKDLKAAAKLRTECEALFERAEKDYADVKVAYRGTVGESAKKELYEIRHLAIGLKAPDVVGEDQDGKKFKLSDYQGKVVLLDFWSEF